MMDHFAAEEMGHPPTLGELLDQIDELVGPRDTEASRTLGASAIEQATRHTVVGGADRKEPAFPVFSDLTKSSEI